jgi:RNA polymerase subunit RPABC4/transcription elongation factor Spt4
MGLKQCDKCTETVDEAKAFCPACGNAFVEEQTRKEVSVFDTMDSTVQLGQTMYNQMLSDMGLNTSAAPNPPEKRVEMITPLTPEAKPAAKIAVEPKPANYRKWLIWGAIAIALLFLVLIALGIAGYIFYRSF